MLQYSKHPHAHHIHTHSYYNHLPNIHPGKLYLCTPLEPIASRTLRLPSIPRATGPACALATPLRTLTSRSVQPLSSFSVNTSSLLKSTSKPILATITCTITTKTLGS